MAPEIRFVGLHAPQQVIADHLDLRPRQGPHDTESEPGTARFVVACCGRRFGKTSLAAVLCCVSGLQGGRAAWIAPTAKLARPGWEYLRELARKIPGCEISLATQVLHFEGGGSVEVRTAQEPGGLIGQGWDLAVLDECARMPQRSWEQEVRPALADRMGRAVFISTPRGRANWFYQLYTRGEDRQGDWASFHFTSFDNPFFPPSEAAEAQRDLPRDVYEQEYLAKFIDAGTSVFDYASVHAMADGWIGLQDGPSVGYQYVSAWDIGRRADPTVGLTAQKSHSGRPNQIVAFERVFRTPYPAIQSMIEARHRVWGGRTIVESNGVGDPVVENVNVPTSQLTPFVVTRRSKVQIVEGLRAALERGAIKCGIPRVIEELEMYEWDDTDLVQDCVMALAELNTGLPSPHDGTLARVMSMQPDLGRAETAGVRNAHY